VKKPISMLHWYARLKIDRVNVSWGSGKKKKTSPNSPEPRKMAMLQVSRGKGARRRLREESATKNNRRKNNKRKAKRIGGKDMYAC